MLDISNERNNGVKITQNLTLTDYQEHSHGEYHAAIEEKYHLTISEVYGKIIDHPEARKEASKKESLPRILEFFRDHPAASGILALIAAILGLLAAIITLMAAFF